jgi:hypothetical protein
MTVSDTLKKPKKGRPLKYLTTEAKKAANAAVSKAYRAKQNGKKEAWRDLKKLPQSDIIDLSALRPAWHLTCS